MPKGIIPREVTCQSALNKTGIPGYGYCLNPYIGCTHQCLYCYASFMGRFNNHPENWGEFLDAKINIAAVLNKQLSGRSRREGRLLIGTVTDAYQPAEAHYGLTRSCLEILSHYPALEVHILTKSSLVIRDLDLLEKLPHCEVGLSLTTLDPKIAQIIEPGASSPALRLAAARQLIKAGIPVWIFIAPLLPGLSDTTKSLTELLSTLKSMGITQVALDNLNAYPVVINRLKNCYRQHFSACQPALEEYLLNTSVYRRKVKSRLGQVSKRLDFKAHFV
ncbi:MAG: radical SAM protein [Syntrophomonadaceae bacterium]|jgi:DNA repair photolyase